MDIVDELLDNYINANNLRSLFYTSTEIKIKERKSSHGHKIIGKKVDNNSLKSKLVFAK